jgi:hypothetical protein
LFMKGYSSNGTKRVALILNTRARGCRDGTEPPKPGFEKCNPRFYHVAFPPIGWVESAAPS